MKKRVLVIIFAVFVTASVIVSRLPSFTAVDYTIPTNSSEYCYIIDAGHGGEDGGAVVGDIIESKINLEVALKLDALMGLYGKNVVLTRDSEELEYPPEADTLRKMKASDSNARKQIIQNTPNAIYVSIHQNKYKTAEPSGAQVFYGLYEGSSELADTLQESMRVILEPANRKAAKLIPDTIYLMKDTRCPAVLIECGFMSNPGELALLTSEAYQNKIAIAVLAGLLQNEKAEEEQLLENAPTPTPLV